MANRCLCVLGRSDSLRLCVKHNHEIGGKDRRVPVLLGQGRYNMQHHGCCSRGRVIDSLLQILTSDSAVPSWNMGVGLLVIFG